MLNSEMENRIVDRGGFWGYGIGLIRASVPEFSL